MELFGLESGAVRMSYDGVIRMESTKVNGDGSTMESSGWSPPK